jgi:type VI secretion system protein ImpC
MPSSLFDENLESKITLESESNSLPEDTPFHILMMGDWGGSSDFSSKPFSVRKFIEIDRDEFDDVIRKITPEVVLNFDGDISLKLTFESLDDFHPDNLFQRVSLFSDLRKIRQNLKKADTFDDAAREVRSWYSDSTDGDNNEKEAIEVSPVSFETENLLDQILGNKQENLSAKQNVSKSPLSEFVGNILAPHIVKTDLEEQSKLLAVVDEIISDLMRKILHHKDFQKMESAWRGLYFLVRRVETGSNLKIFLIQITKEELLDNFSSVSSLSESIFYEWIVESDSLSLGSSPWATVFGNYEFSPNVEDTAALIRISKIAKVAGCPFISQISPELFGIRSFENLSHDVLWKISPETPEYKLWNALRAIPESVYLGLCFPKFIGRLSYGEQTKPTENFTFEEFKNTPVHNQYLWLNPSFAYSYVLAEQYKLNGWDIDQDGSTDLEDLPIHIYKSDGETTVKSCVGIDMTETIYNSIISQGIMALISFKEEDRIRLSALRSISSESSKLKGKW